MAKVALIFGATGIVGSALVDELAKTSKDEWKNIIFTSRREPHLGVKDDRFQFVSIDLEQEDVDTIKAKLKGAGAAETTHVYFTAYIHEKSWNGEILSQKNTPIFKKSITAVDSIAPHLQRIVLQLGMKYYGIHVAPLKGPFPVNEKTSPRHPPIPGNPDFYFEQEDFLVELQKGKKWTYTTTRPNVIFGVTRGNGMSFAPTIALYFLIQKELGKKATFPGPEISYKSILDTSNASVIAQFSILASTHPKAANEAYNILDQAMGRHHTFEDVWRAIGEYFGVEVEGPGAKEFSFQEYAKDKESVWKQFVNKHGGYEELWNYATWDVTDAIVHMQWANGPFDMTKAREELGWKTELTAQQSIIQVFDKMKHLKWIPAK